MRIVEIGTGTVRRPPVEGGPEVELLVGGGEADAQGLAAAHITIPPGGGMPEHDHGESAALLAVQRGRITMRSGDDERALPVGTLAVIGAGERVSVSNPDGRAAVLLAVFAPPAFGSRVASWPEA